MINHLAKILLVSLLILVIHIAGYVKIHWFPVFVTQIFPVAQSEDPIAQYHYVLMKILDLL